MNVGHSARVNLIKAGTRISFRQRQVSFIWNDFFFYLLNNILRRISSHLDHFTYCLRCKQNCTREMSLIRGKIYDDLFASHYEYLHISYYKENNLKEACRATASFLLLFPNSEEMLENMHYYQNMIDVEESFFKPRSVRHNLCAMLIYLYDVFLLIHRRQCTISSDNATSTPSWRSSIANLLGFRKPLTRFSHER